MTRPIPTAMMIAVASLTACQSPAPKASSTPPVTTPTSRPPRLEIDGKKLSEESSSQILHGTPISVLNVKKSLLLNGRPLQPHVLRTGEFIFVHSQRSLWSPRASGQAFFDTFLFGCQALPPSPLDRVVNEGIELRSGQSVLIEEYPDRAATPIGQDFAFIQCAN